MLRESIAQRAETLRAALANTAECIVVRERPSGAFVFAWSTDAARIRTRTIFWLDDEGTRCAFREVRHAA